MGPDIQRLHCPPVLVMASVAVMKHHDKKKKKKERKKRKRKKGKVEGEKGFIGFILSNCTPSLKEEVSTGTQTGQEPGGRS